MNSKALLAIAALALVASTGARADQTDPAYGTQAFEGTRSRDEVRVEAAWAARNPVYDHEGMRFEPQATSTQATSTLDRATVRAETARALRDGELALGEAAQYDTRLMGGPKEKSTLQRATVRAEAVQALRTGKLTSGEASQY